MTAAAVPPATRPAVPAQLGGDAPDSAEAPRLAPGTELLGEYKNSGYQYPPSLVRRADGQVIQMSRLLYLVASRMDGSRPPADIAELVTGDLGRHLTAEQVRYLITAKLMPLGIVAGPGAPAAPPKANPLLALRARATLLPERAANAVSAVLRPTFRLPVMAAVAATVGAVDYWLFASNGLAIGLQQVMRDPADLLIVLALTLASAAFHECGHAAACHYGGARPGRIGAGIYLVWPSFFTNVTDSYRLGRAGRLRTDLGGLYFNLIFILGMAAVYAATSAWVLLLVIALTHLQMLEQLLPFARFDGYYILSDLTGIPDLFARAVPIVKGTLTGRTDARTAGLTRPARITVTVWVLCVIPLLTVTVGYLILRLPQTNRALWHAAGSQAHLTAAAAAGHHYVAALTAAVGVALTAVTAAGTLYIAAGLARRAVTAGLRWSAAQPGRRSLVVIAALACAAGLVACWALQGQFSGW